MITEETRRKMSESHSGEKHWLFGKHHSPETCEKIRKANTGSGNWNYGRITPDSVKEKQRIAATGKHHTDETKAKMRAIRLGVRRGGYKLKFVIKNLNDIYGNLQTGIK